MEKIAGYYILIIRIENDYGKKYFFVRTDLGDMKMYCKKNMFITKAKARDNKIKEILK